MSAPGAARIPEPSYFTGLRGWARASRSRARAAPQVGSAAEDWEASVRAGDRAREAAASTEAADLVAQVRARVSFSFGEGLT